MNLEAPKTDMNQNIKTNLDPAVILNVINNTNNLENNINSIVKEFINQYYLFNNNKRGGAEIFDSILESMDSEYKIILKDLDDIINSNDIDITLKESTIKYRNHISKFFNELISIIINIKSSFKSQINKIDNEIYLMSNRLDQAVVNYLNSSISE